jgi:hypothetical protein
MIDNKFIIFLLLLLHYVFYIIKGIYSTIDVNGVVPSIILDLLLLHVLNMPIHELVLYRILPIYKQFLVLHDGLLLQITPRDTEVIKEVELRLLHAILHGLEVCICECHTQDTPEECILYHHLHHELILLLVVELVLHDLCFHALHNLTHLALQSTYTLIPHRYFPLRLVQLMLQEDQLILQVFILLFF